MKELIVNNYKIKYTGILKSGLPLTSTFEVIFDSPVKLNSEEYKTAEREVREIITQVSINY